MAKFNLCLKFIRNIFLFCNMLLRMNEIWIQADLVINGNSPLDDRSSIPVTALVVLIVLKINKMYSSIFLVAFFSNNNIISMKNVSLSLVLKSLYF